MEINETKIEGLQIIKPRVFQDSRGYFFEGYNKQIYNQAGIASEFIQDNISESKKGTIRGLHYQVGEKAQGKLCQVLYGTGLDVAVDIRFGSPTFGNYLALELSEENHLQLWIPPGFAHGFSVLSETAIFSYKCTELYSKENERAIVFNDADLKIDWKVNDPVLSEKDLKAPFFKDIKKDFIY